ncbi:hypothetical protein BH11PAT1_BH11PAT1_7590 [soil metagenome]
MTQKLSNLIVGGICLIVLIGISIYSLTASYSLDKATLSQHTKDLESYTKEALFLTHLYNTDRITSAYFRTQIGYLNRKVLTFYDLFETTYPTNNQLPSLQKESKIVTELSLILSQLSGPIEKTQVTNKEKNLQALSHELSVLSKTYE